MPETQKINQTGIKMNNQEEKNIETTESAEEEKISYLRACPKFCIGAYILCAAAAILHISFLIPGGFADFFNRYISSFFRAVFAYITGWLPFSLGETVIIALPFIFVMLIAAIFTVFAKNIRLMKRWTCILLSVLSLMYSAFVFNFAAGYRTETLDKKLGIERSTVSKEELKYTAEQVAKELNNILAEADKSEEGRIIFGLSGSSVMPYTRTEMIKKLNEAYKKVHEQYPEFIPDLNVTVKQVSLSVPMTYTHISGVYSYYTGEANININFPDYTLPFTAAHEMSHQRGIAREDEANFMAFLVCRESDDLYIRYCAYQNLLEYILSALAAADYAGFVEVVRALDSRSYGEMAAYNVFFEKYRESAASEVSSAVNDTYLKIQGQEEGERSYGMVVDLAVSYYAENSENAVNSEKSEK